MTSTSHITPGAEAPAPVPPLRRNRDFRMLWVGAGASLLGTRVAVAAYPLMILWGGGTPADASLVAFATLLPQLLFVLPAGALVDRWNRRRAMLICDAVGFSGMASLVVALLFGEVWLPHVMLVAFLDGAAVIVYRLAERASVRHVVHPTHLGAALSQNEARGQSTGLIGQPAGTALYSVFRWLPFLFATVTHLVAFVTLLTVRRDLQDERVKPRRMLTTEIAEGFAWVWRHRFMRSAILLVGGSNLAFQVINLTLVLIIREGGHPPYMVGLLGLLGGLGGLLGALGAARVMRRVPVQAILIGVLALWAVLIALVAVTTLPAGLGALMGGMAALGALLNVAAATYQIRVTPDVMQGRVTSVFALIGSGLNSVGALLGGVLLSAAGTSGAALITAAGMGVLAFLALCVPSIRRPPVE
ncbi:hypothetical protein GCM10010112_05840 [Actinoplanes lobatus]|uniref:MFS family permease n=1 Tax=Actinoplanes lobatus TaxID=113568 RepID=A0A7W7HAH0_9ACTN|nr:MFS transporter [Actinoplanes lobatus]MBB4747005.1 MFS family permease [Actinoplanes lobatus]GGN55261.1 hypothetical protein GCM10010112_05840 [Actinoplanes lobatus]GIE45981.1 hypothetical protein Alo02nite_88790 [Actinoplanes lobatus]